MQGEECKVQTGRNGNDGNDGNRVHFLVLSSRRATEASRSLRRCRSSDLASLSFSRRVRKRASILSRSMLSSWWNSVLVTNWLSGGLRRKSFLASTAIDAMAAAESNQFSMEPLAGAGVWERR